MTSIPPIVQAILNQLLIVFLVLIVVGSLGYYWGYKVTSTGGGTTNIHKFYGVSASGDVRGFFCIGTSAVPTCTGAGNNRNCGTLANNAGQKLTGYKLPAPPSSGVAGAVACCKDKPKVIRSDALGNKKTFVLLNSTICF